MPRTGLDRDRIVAAALDLLDEVGLDNLSTRALARRLDVQSPALYWHFASKTDLVSAMAEAMMLELPDAGSVERAGTSRAAMAGWLVERAQAFRHTLLSRRDGARVHAGSRPPNSRLAGVEAQIEALCRTGMAPLDAARATLAISRFVVGWVLEEQSDGTAGDLPDLSAYPRLTDVRTLLVGTDPDADFDACLAALVHGLLRR